MNKTKKIVSGVLSGALAVSMVTPALAQTANGATIDESRKGTLNIHKIVENDGTLKNADGLGKDGIAGAVEVDNIGFDYVMLASIENIEGILVSEDGSIDLNAGNGEVSVGTYYEANEKLAGLFDAAGIYPDATYIKTEVPASEDATLQYSWADNVKNSLLSDEQDGVDEAEAALKTSKDALKAAQNTYSGLVSAARSSAADATAKQAAADKAAADATKAEAAAAAAEAAAGELGDQADAASQTAEGLANAYAEALEAYEEALNEYNNSDDADPGTLQKLNEAKEALRDAVNAFDAASDAYALASSEASRASENASKAQAAFDAAAQILQEAKAAQQRAATGTPDSATGTANAVEYAQEQYDNAEAYLKACNDALFGEGGSVDAPTGGALKAQADAKASMDAAMTALFGEGGTAEAPTGGAQKAFNDAVANNNTAYNTFKAAFQEMNRLAKESDDAAAANENLQAAADDAQEKATQLRAAATAARESAGALGDIATSANNDAATTSAQADAYRDGELKNAQEDYDAKLAAYKAAVAALDAKATANGIKKVYTAEGLEKAMQQIITTLGETKVNEWVKDNAPTANGDLAEGYTDDHGVVSFSGMDLGLYIVAETDITYHDGYAGAWNDGESGFINNDPMNTYDADGYHIQPVDGFANETVHDYAKGDLYRESHNPEAPVIETPAAPFLVSLPSTNTTDTTEADVAAGDNFGEKGTVWQYTIDVFPKNQTTAIYKRIVDPDEKDGEETLRTSEDYQIGDNIEQVIWADAPVLQKNYLFDANDEGFGDGVEGDLDDREDMDGSKNRHIGYVISDTMTNGLSFDKVTSVVVIPKSQLAGVNTEKTFYIDGEGAVIDAADAFEDDGTTLKSTVKYFDNEGHEISAEMFTARTGEAVDGIEFFSDIDKDGKEQGTGTTYPAKAELTGTYYATRISYKKVVLPAGSVTIPESVDAFDINYNAADDEGIELVAGVDYNVVNTNDQEVVLVDSEGNEHVAVERITSDDYHGFAVVLTPEGLAKLDGRTSDSVVVVKFDSILNKNAKIGQIAENMNYPSLSWINTNTSLKKIEGNSVYDYTYELQIKKNGVKDGRNVKFVISRDDKGDFAQVPEKDLTDTVSKEQHFNQDDSIWFVEEAPGVYHVWGFLDGENTDEGDAAGSYEKSIVNGVEFCTVTPAEDGKLVLKGLDSNDYTFKEIQTEDENNLLKDTFTVSIRANDNTAEDPLSSLRNGAIAKATVTSGNASADITVGVAGVTEGQDISAAIAKNLGIASMEVNNYDAIDLRTGGQGRVMYYIMGGALAGGLAIGMYVVGKKKASDEEA